MLPCSRRRPYKPTRHNARSFFLGTNLGLATLLLLGMIFLIGLGTVAWMSAGDCKGKSHDERRAGAETKQNDGAPR